MPGCAHYSRKQLDELADFVKRPQVGAKGLVYIKYDENGTAKSSVDKILHTRTITRREENYKCKQWRFSTDIVRRQC